MKHLKKLIVLVLLIGLCLLSNDGIREASASRWKLLTARWGTGAGETDDVRIDGSTNSLQTIDYAHHEIHGGSCWDITDKADLPGDDFLDIRFTTDAGTKYAHLTIEYHSEDETEWWLYENVTMTTVHGSATALTPRNHRRPSGDSGTIVTASYIINTTLANANSDTGIGSATEIGHGQQGAGRNTPTSGSSREEWILLPGEDYSLRFEDIGGSAGYISWHLDWYEHTDKH